MISQVCAEIRNYFLRNPQEDIHTGTFVISGGNIEPLSFLQNGQYFRIVDSAFNDGVYKYGDGNLQDEQFTGSIWAMAVPPAVIALCSDIENWLSNNADALSSPYASESFGGYSYTMKSGRSSSGTYSELSWQRQFSARLNPYRRVSVL